MARNTKIIAISGVVAALYISLMYLTQGFAFGAYQIRIATGLYSLCYIFPFLVLPMGLANCLSNVLMGGLGLPDIIGGAAVGLATSGVISLISLRRLPAVLTVPVIIIIPGMMVPLWLAPLLQIPYWTLTLSLCIGQTPPAIAGYALLKLLSGRAALLKNAGNKDG